MKIKTIFYLLVLSTGVFSAAVSAESLEQIEYGLAEAPSSEPDTPKEIPIQPLPAPASLPQTQPAAPVEAAPAETKPPKESFTLNPPPPADAFKKEFEFQLQSSFLPYDALYKPILLEASIQWEFKKNWLWEIGRFGWALAKLESGLRDQVQGDLERELDGVKGIDPKNIRVLEGNEMKKLRFIAGSSMGYRFLDGDLTAFGKKQFHHEWIFNLGGMYFNMRNKHQAGPTIGTQIRFKFDEHFNAQIRADQAIGVMMKKQNSIGIFGLGVGYRF